MYQRRTRRERLKSALHLRLKKRKSFQNCKKRDPLGFLKLQFPAKYQKNEGEKKIKKVAQCRKNPKGDPRVLLNKKKRRLKTEMLIQRPPKLGGGELSAFYCFVEFVRLKKNCYNGI